MASQCHLVFPRLLNLHSQWGGPPGPQPTPTSACRVLKEADSVGEGRVQGDPRRPGGLPWGLPHYDGTMPSFGKTKWHWAKALAPLPMPCVGRSADAARMSACATCGLEACRADGDRVSMACLPAILQNAAWLFAPPDGKS